jgi:peptide/nickel transport system substrate-binding protein
MFWLRLILTSTLGAGALMAQWGGELRLCLHSEPRTFHPARVDDTDSETIRYLTGGVLIRVNRLTQRLEPALATSWKVDRDGRRIVFQLRPGQHFSDGTPFHADDVAYTMEVLLDPNLHSPTGEGFRAGGSAVKSVVHGDSSVELLFPQPVAGLARLFDQVAILSRHSPNKEMAVLGPFHVAEHVPGSYLLLVRNPYYWKTEQGRRLPYLDSIRLEIQKNRELELLKYRRGQIHMIAALDPDQYQQLAADAPASVADAGLTLEGELLWFNLNPSAPIPASRKAWFNSQNFRLAISHAIRRDDLARLVYHGHAAAAAGPFSRANQYWFNQKLRPHSFDLALSRRLLAQDGFRFDGSTLRDRAGNAVEFSLITNAGNRARERIAAMLQQDLAALGVRLNIVTLDFPSLMERISKSFQYEACLLGMNNVDLDPNGQLNVWLSSAPNHQWHPNQTQPATAWEAEIDRLMRLQASTSDESRRRAAFDKVQQIVSDEAPVLYLVQKNALVAASCEVKNLAPSVLRPQLLWNADSLWLDKSRCRATEFNKNVASR